MRTLPLSLLLLAACGGSSTPTPAPEPAPAEPEPALSAGPLADAAAVAALLADLPSEPIVNELSGQTDGTLYRLPAARTLGGVPCVEQVQVLSETWGCTLGSAHTVGAFELPAGAFAPVHYRTGQLAALPFEGQRDVLGFPCLDYAHFHPSGALAGCALYREHAIGPNTFPANTDVRLREDGSVESIVIYWAATIGGRELPPGTVTFAPDGSVAEVQEGVFGE